MKIRCPHCLKGVKLDVLHEVVNKFPETGNSSIKQIWLCDNCKGLFHLTWEPTLLQKYTKGDVI